MLYPDRLKSDPSSLERYADHEMLVEAALATTTADDPNLKLVFYQRLDGSFYARLWRDDFMQPARILCHVSKENSYRHRIGMFYVSADLIRVSEDRGSILFVFHHAAHAGRWGIIRGGEVLTDEQMWLALPDEKRQVSTCVHTFPDKPLLAWVFVDDGPCRRQLGILRGASIERIMKCSKEEWCEPTSDLSFFEGRLTYSYRSMMKDANRYIFVTKEVLVTGEHTIVLREGVIPYRPAQQMWKIDRGRLLAFQDQDQQRHHIEVMANGSVERIDAFLEDRTIQVCLAHPENGELVYFTYDYVTGLYWIETKFGRNQVSCGQVVNKQIKFSMFLGKPIAIICENADPDKGVFAKELARLHVPIERK